MNPDSSSRIDIESIKQRTSPVDLIGRFVELKPEGSEWVACCPFHDDSTPSFHVTDLGWICFGCGARGDVIRFVQLWENIEFREAAARVIELTSGSGDDTPPRAAPPKQGAANPFAAGSNGTGSKPRAPGSRLEEIGKHVESYEYVTVSGDKVLQVRRYEKHDDSGKRISKDFLQFRWDKQRGDWMPGINDKITKKRLIPYVLYRLPQVSRAEKVYLLEGEKDVHAAESWGLAATTNAGGAKQPWASEYNEQLAGRDIVIIPDNDAAGITRGEELVRQLAGVARTLRVVKMPDGIKDLTDYKAAGRTLEDLLALEEQCANETFSYVARDDWRNLLLTTATGGYRPVLANCITALRYAKDWDGVLGYNDFSLAVTAMATPPWPGGRTGAWTDHEDSLATNWMHQEGIFANVDTVGRAIQTVARDHSEHPVRAWLNSLVWDGDSRLHSWLSRLLGVEDNMYTRAVGSRWMVSAVARVFQPGCKADCALILEGPQGARKSTALRTLGEPWFTDEIDDLGSKDAAIQTAGVWIIEIAELDSMNRSDVGRVKAFLSRGTDRYRPPYGRRTIESPRQCVFAGSVNHTNYLRDETGGRRFWPVACTQIDIAALERERDQLWAEAVVAYRNGAPWWLENAELNKLAEDEQMERYEGDPWDELIADWVREPRPQRDSSGAPLQPWSSDVGDVTVIDILTHCIHKRADQWTQADKNRVVRTLRALRWEKFRRTVDRAWAYRPKGTSWRG